jgi:hypothetical protein
MLKEILVAQTERLCVVSAGKGDMIVASIEYLKEEEEKK